MPEPETVHIFPYPLFTEEKPRWWCEDCGAVTEFEHHPDWIAAGRPMVITGSSGDPKYFPEKYRWDLPEDYGWIARCSVCKVPAYDDVPEMACPSCGWPGVQDDDPETNGVRYGPKRALGGPDWGEEWTETVTCGGCGEEYSYDCQSV